jgi:hypothetical protein
VVVNSINYKPGDVVDLGANLNLNVLSPPLIANVVG